MRCAIAWMAISATRTVQPCGKDWGVNCEEEKAFHDSHARRVHQFRSVAGLWRGQSVEPRALYAESAESQWPTTGDSISRLVDCRQSDWRAGGRHDARGD